MTEQLQKKVDRAIKLIQSASKIAAANGCPEIEVAYSGGKDSDVILELTKMSGVPYRAIHHVTTLDPAGTIKHAEKMGAEIVRPKDNFGQLIAKYGLPNRFMRFCCGILKEKKTLDYAIVGIRRSESPKRSERYKEPEQCRVFSKKKGDKVRQYFPILEWTDNDIAEFIKERNIKLHSLYYKQDGSIDVTQRLGCMCCPVKGKRLRIDDFKQHPNMVKLYIRNMKKFIKSHPDKKQIQEYNGDVYAWFVRDVFFPDDTQGWFNMNHNSLLPPPIIKIS